MTILPNFGTYDSFALGLNIDMKEDEATLPPMTPRSYLLQSQTCTATLLILHIIPIVE